jgi:hypothetical protein
VRSVGANYVADLILVDYDENMIDTSTIVALIKKVGYEAVPIATTFL